MHCLHPLLKLDVKLTSFFPCVLLSWLPLDKCIWDALNWSKRSLRLGYSHQKKGWKKLTSVSHMACSSDPCVLSCICTYWTVNIFHMSTVQCPETIMTLLRKILWIGGLWLNYLTKMMNVPEISITIMTFTLLQLIRVNCGAEMVCPWRPSQPMLCCLCQCPLLFPLVCPPAPVNAHYYAHQAHQCPRATRLPGRRKFSQCVVPFDMVWKCGAPVVW